MYGSVGEREASRLASRGWHHVNVVNQLARHAYECERLSVWRNCRLLIAEPPFRWHGELLRFKLIDRESIKTGRTISRARVGIHDEIVPRPGNDPCWAPCRRYELSREELAFRTAGCRNCKDGSFRV